MHFDGIWNNLELQRNSWKHCLYSMRSDGIWNNWNCKETLKTLSLQHALWRYLKRFDTAENILKTFSLKHAFWRYWKLFGTAENLSKQNVFKACTMVVFKKDLNCSKNNNNENKDGKVCIVTVFQTIWKCRKHENKGRRRSKFISWISWQNPFKHYASWAYQGPVS